jgi:membrane protein insertase Oxa1/YidC/SpoIIIJ
MYGTALRASRRSIDGRRRLKEGTSQRSISIIADHHSLFRDDERESKEKRFFSPPSRTHNTRRGLATSPLLSRGSSLQQQQHHPQLALSNTINMLSQCQQTRSITSWLPEVVQNFSIWGGSGFLLKALHADGAGLPYWACFAVINLLVRVSLIPVVIYGAQTSARFARVVPEVQFLLTLFQNDMTKLREEKAPWVKKAILMRTSLGTLGGIYKLHKINPFSIFLSPLLQLPIFWYVSVDLRKIVNGLDPMLAQQLVESSVAWVPDLTEPDPWFGLPVLAGLVMYANVEVAVGKRNLSGPTAAKSDTAVLLKDVFQSVAVFMPCFTSQMPGGVQIYLTTSFAFTVLQSGALRTESMRMAVGLPSMLAPPPEARYAKEFIKLKQLEQKAREIRGDGPVLGKNAVLAMDFTASFPGEYRKSTIQGSGILNSPFAGKAIGTTISTNAAERSSPPAMKVVPPEGPFINGVSAPLWQLVEQQEQQRKMQRDDQVEEPVANTLSSDREYMPQFADEVMEKANRGEMPRATQFVNRDKSKAPEKLNPKRFNKKKAGTKNRRR